jgi:predicted ATPase
VARLQRLTLNGFKSIKAMDLELRPLNVLIGANGAGKSNLISFFKMLNEMMAGRFQQYIGISGRAQSLLHFGPKTTLQIEAKLEFEVENKQDIYHQDIYHIRLFHAAGDTLIFAEEQLSFLQASWTSPRVYELGAGHQEAKISETLKDGRQTSNTVRIKPRYSRLILYLGHILQQ